MDETLRERLRLSVTRRRRTTGVASSRRGSRLIKARHATVTQGPKLAVRTALKVRARMTGVTMSERGVPGIKLGQYAGIGIKREAITIRIESFAHQLLSRRRCPLHSRLAPLKATLYTLCVPRRGQVCV